MVLRDMTLENPIRAIREISHDITCTRRVRLANGREASALEIQAEYLTRALRYAETRGLVPARTTRARDVGALPDRHREGSAEPRSRVRLGHQAQPHRGVPRASRPAAHRPKVALIDLQYHDVNRDRGLFYRMQARGLVDRICDDAEIDKAVDEPPQTTRARLRGEFIRRAKERKRDYTVDWVHLKLNDQAQRTVLCKDPFKAHDERVEKLIASL